MGKEAVSREGERSHIWKRRKRESQRGAQSPTDVPIDVPPADAVDIIPQNSPASSREMSPRADHLNWDATDRLEKGFVEKKKKESRYTSSSMLVFAFGNGALRSRQHDTIGQQGT